MVFLKYLLPSIGAPELQFFFHAIASILLSQKAPPIIKDGAKCLNYIYFYQVIPLTLPQVPFVYFACLIAACAAASLAIGTRNGEQDT